MEAAMTGHLVFSTIHTNSAAETITRVLNLGAKPYMLAGTFNFVMAQRLSRKTCKNCLHEVDAKADKLYLWAREELARIPKEILVTEMKKRKIDDTMWQRFIQGNVLM